jgi:taurine dioxygenase
MRITKTGGPCGAEVDGLDLRQPLSQDCIAELRSHWIEHKLLIFKNQDLSGDDLERFTLCFGDFGEDPFFSSIDGHDHIAAIRRDADETTPIFAEFFHSDWSFLEIPPAGTILYGITIPPTGGNTLFADQTAAYQSLPPALKARADQLTAIHSAQRGYAPSGLYGDNDKQSGRSMDIVVSEKAMETRQHPFVRTHRETGKKALYSSPAYILGFEGMSEEESNSLLGQFYQHQIAPEVTYSHKWEKGMLVMWDNRSLLHAATGGYDGHERLLHRTTVGDIAF